MEQDIVIIGCGPAGLQAAIHAARAKVRVTVVGRVESSSLASAEIENYLGIRRAEGIGILKVGMEQAEGFGATFIEGDVVKLRRDGEGFVALTDQDVEVQSKALILAPGISRKKLGVKGEKELLGMGVSYCAQCDCNFYGDRKVAIVGDGSEAASSSILMTEYASEVTWVTEDPEVSERLMGKVIESGVAVVKGRKVSSIEGDRFVERAVLDDGTVLEVDGVFIEIGARSSVELAFDVDILPTPEGTIQVDADCATEVAGVFACGDVTGKPWQLARAVGQGCIAGTRAAKYVRG